MRLEVITAERVLFEGDVDVVVAPGSEGEIAILPGHVALMTTLQPGELRYRHGVDETYLSMTGGFLEVARDTVTVLADAAERSEEIDEARAIEAMRRAEERVVGREADLDMERALHAMRRARVRVQAVTRRRRRREQQGPPGISGA